MWASRANFFRTMLRVSSTSVTNFPIVARDFSNSNAVQFDTCGGVLDLPQTRHRGEADGLVEEPYWLETVACLVRKLGKGDTFTVFFGSSYRFHGQIRDAGIEVTFNKIHHWFPAEFDSYVCLRSQAGDETYIFEFWASKLEDTQGCCGHFRCFRGLKAPRGPETEGKM